MKIIDLGLPKPFSENLCLHFLHLPIKTPETLQFSEPICSYPFKKKGGVNSMMGVEDNLTVQAVQ